MRVPCGIATLILVVCAVAGPAIAAKKAEKVVLLPDGYPPLEYDESALAGVPGIESAPAVVLFEARQQQWERTFSRIHRYYRVKILNEDGVAEFGDYSQALYGEWRIKKVEARTVLPGGEIIDASEGVFRDKSSDGVKTLDVTWPQVQVGAILDLHLSLTADYASLPAWIVQGYLPVLESRFVMVPPDGMSYATAVHGFPETMREPEIHRQSQGKVLVWRFANVPAIPREPNQPALMNIAKKLFVIPTDIRSPFTGAKVALARDWKSFSYYGKESWDAWLEAGASDAKSLAKEVAAAETTATSKAEAIRRALRERVHVEYVSDGAIHETPNEVLSMGTGTSGEIAGTAVAMLRAVDVEADLAAVRLRSSGLMPSNMPVPSLFNDLIVRIKEGKQDLFFSPANDVPVGTLHWNHRGTAALPYDGKSKEPVEIPDYTADENKTLHVVEATLDRSGKLTGQSTHTYHDVAGQKWRARLKELDQGERESTFQDRLRRWMPGLRLGSLEVEHLDHGEDLVVRCAWDVEGYARKLPSRLLVNLQLLSRQELDDWPTQARQTELHLGGPYESSVVVHLGLPEGFESVKLPENARKTADPVGVYQAKYEQTGNTITAERTMRMNLFWFPPKAYAGLRAWIQDISADDDKLALVSFP